MASIPRPILLAFSLVLLHSILITAQGPYSGYQSCSRIPRYPRPAGLKCGTRGSVKTPKVLDRFDAKAPFVTTQQLFYDCQNLCLDRGLACQSWSINNQLLRCVVYNSTIEAMTFTAGSANTLPLWYSRGCVDENCGTSQEFTLTVPDVGPGEEIDDANYEVCPPMALRFYGVNYRCVNVSTNGLLSFGGRTTEYLNSALPNYSSIPGAALFVYWDDLLIQPTRTRVMADHSVSWRFSGIGPGRSVSFTWRAKVLGTGSESWIDATATFDEGRDILDVRYNWAVNVDGTGATIGMQNPSGRYMQVSYNSAFDPRIRLIRYNMAANTYENLGGV